MSAPDLESRLIDLARQRNLLAEDTPPSSGPAPAPARPAGRGSRLSELLRRGQLKQEDLLALASESGVTSGFAPWDDRREEADSPPEPAWQGYHHLSIIGAGRNALVCRAQDVRLNRWVALKFPHAAPAGRLSHLLLEARAQAKVDHPNVLKVLETGEHEGHPFIALQLVEGGSLEDCWPSFALETRVLLMKGVAEGLQAAHAQGLLHLDIKPSNILVDTSQPGAPWPYLTDFGADFGANAGTDREEAQRHSPSGTIPFASPERLAGGTAAVDQRSDVYSLGATLYAILAGQPPSTQGPEERPRATSGPLKGGDPGLRADLPTDLRAITDKCLRRDPSERYASARALAEDLQRFLEGAPVAARGASPGYRFEKWAQRNRSLSILGALALVCLAVLGAVSVYHARRQAFRLALADRYGKDVGSVGQQLELAHMSRQHDRRPEVAKVRETMDRIRQEMRALGSNAFGPGSFALGAGHAALGEWKEARRHLDTAWEAGFRTPACAQIRGEVLTRLFRDAKATIKSADPAQRAAELRQAEKEFRDPAKACFLVARQGERHTKYQEAMEAYLAGDSAQALALAQAASQEAPWFYQADLLRCTILNELGTAAYEASDIEAAQRHFLQSSQIVAKVLEIAPSAPGNWIIQGNAFWNLYTNNDSETRWRDGAIASYETAIKVDPDLPEGYAFLSGSIADLARQAWRDDKDPMPLYDRAVALAEQSLKRTPPGERRTILAETLMWRADRATNLGKDSRADLDRAIAELKASIAGTKLISHDCFLLRNAHQARAWAAYAWGEDPLPFSREAVHWATEDLKFNAGSLLAERVLTYVQLDLGDYERSSGKPFSVSPAELIRRVEALIGRQPKGVPVPEVDQGMLSDAYLLEAEQRIRSGEDPRSAFEAALQICVQTDPGKPNRMARLGGIALRYGAFLWRHQESPQRILEIGLAAVRQAASPGKQEPSQRCIRAALAGLLARSQGREAEARRLASEVARWKKALPPGEARTVQERLDLWDPQGR